MVSATPLEPRVTRPAVDLSPYRMHDSLIGAWQVGSTLAAYVLCWVLLIAAAGSLVVVPLIVVAAGLLIRLFVLQHDCGHHSLFTSARANDAVGSCLGVLTSTPYFLWRYTHALHHKTSGKFDRRDEVTDIYTMTVEEYARAPRWHRIGYRAFRNPWILFGVLPAIVFLGWQRVVWSHGSGRRDRWSVHGTNLGMIAMGCLVGELMGYAAGIGLLVAVTAIAASIGMWLFYVQHQFEHAYWQPDGTWRFDDASLAGSSHLRLPRILRWFTADIGVHHLHHLDVRIPNHQLDRCVREHPELQARTVLTLRDSFRTIRANLWDERTQRMVSFAEARLGAAELP